jgi:16S rRNA (guanine(527)-N(7))-methyltransferase RsmG
VEHTELRDWAAERQIEIDSHTEELLLNYAYLIYSTNKKYNLTGLQSLHDIIVNLIIGSIEPFRSIHVPRGTIFADIGTGAGIPGIPLAIYYKAWNGVLIDSSNKKISFVNSVIRDLNLENLDSRCGRIEELARGTMREALDIVVSRALGEMYFVMEAGAPFLKKGGFLYIYSKLGQDDMPQLLIEHGRRLGLSLMNLGKYDYYDIEQSGIIFLKTHVTDIKFPRNMAAIKREIKKYLGNVEKHRYQNK